MSIDEYEHKHINTWPYKLINFIKGKLVSKFFTLTGRLGGDGIIYPAADKVLVYNIDVKVVQTTAGYDKPVIIDLAGTLGVEQDELDQYQAIVTSVRSEAPGNSSSDDDFDVRIHSNTDETYGKNSKCQDMYMNTHTARKYFQLNRFCNNITMGSGNWAAAETFNFIVHVEIWKIFVGRRTQ